MANTMSNDHDNEFDFEEVPRLTGTPYERAPLWAASTSPKPMPVELPRRAPVSSVRFGKRIDDIKSAGESGLSGPGEELYELFKKYAPSGMAEGPKARDALLEAALIVETAHATVADLSDAVRRGPETRPTPMGDLIGINTRVLSPMISADIANIRGEARHGAGARRAPLQLVPPVSGEYDTEGGERCIEVRSTDHFMRLYKKQRDALGFTGTRILDTRDRADLENVAAQGVQKPLTLVVTRVTDGDPEAGLAAYLSAIDGSRRVNMAHWAYDRILPDLGASYLAFRHMTDGFGNVTDFAPFTEETAVATRELMRAAIADFAADGPSGSPAKDAQKIAEWAARLNGEEQVLLRLLTVPAFIVIGVDQSSVVSGVQHPMTECLKAYTNSLHVRQQAELEWEEKAIWLDVGRRILRRLDGHQFEHLGPWVTGLLFQPDVFNWRSGELAHTASAEVATHADPAWAERADGAELAEIDETGVVPLTLIKDLVPALDTGEEAVMTKLEVMLAATASMVCRGDRSVDKVVSEELASRGLPNSPKQRAQVMAATVLGMVGLPLEGTESARVHAALSRTPTHSDVWQLSSNEDPLGEIGNWTELIGWKFLELLDRAEAEGAAIVEARRNPAESFGPAQVMLALAGAYAQIVNPALISDETHQLTLSGLGHRHGPVASEPMVVALNLVKDYDGRRQLAEMIVALVNDCGPCLPRSVRYSPKRRDRREHEGDQHRYGVVLTEYDLRGSTFWPDRIDEDGTLRDVPIGALGSNERFFKDMSDRLGEFARRCKEVADPIRAGVVDPELNVAADEYGGSVTKAFLEAGLEVTVANSVKSAIHAIEDVVSDGRLIRIRAEGNGRQ